MASIWEELQRRNVVKVAVAYVIVGWLILQLTDVLISLLDLPEWTGRLVFLLMLIGFPLAMFFAWVYELTPEGLKKETEVARSESITRQTGRKLDFLIIGVLTIAVIYLLADKVFWTDQDGALSTATTESSVAVLPFADMSPAKDQEYFSDGIAEELLNQLAQIRGLQVAGRTSSFAFKGQNEDLRVIGEKLNVAHVLEGSVRKSGERVRITAQLVKATDGYHVWSETFDRDLTDIFGIQEEIAKAVASSLSIALGVGAGDLSLGGTRNFDAYDAYLAGISLSRELTRDGTRQAIELLEKAVALDPDYAQAWSALAIAYDSSAFLFIAGRTEDLLAKSRAASQRAVATAPDAVASVRAAAFVHLRNRNWEQAEQSFRKALERSPADFDTNLYYGLFLAGAGRPTDAMAYYRQAARTEPLLSLPVLQQALAHEMNGNLEPALAEYERAEALIGNESFRQLFIAVLAMEMGDRALLTEAVDKASSAGEAPAITRLLNSTMVSLLDAPQAARSELRRLSTQQDFELRVLRAGMAVWASYFGDHELALEIYRELYESGDLNVFVIWRPIEKNTRRLPGFKELLRNIGLLDYWRNSGNWGQFCRPAGQADFECE
jgi:TolB-like protein